jgi:hypothetical protein
LGVGINCLSEFAQVRIVAEGNDRPISLNADHRDTQFLETIRQGRWRSVGRKRNSKHEVGLDACRRLRTRARLFLDLVDAPAEYAGEL